MLQQPEISAALDVDKIPSTSEETHNGIAERNTADEKTEETKKDTSGNVSEQNLPKTDDKEGGTDLALPSPPHSPPSTPRPAPRIQRPGSGTVAQQSSSGTERPVSGTQHPPSGTQRPASTIKRLGSGVQWSSSDTSHEQKENDWPSSARQDSPSDGAEKGQNKENPMEAEESMAQQDKIEEQPVNNENTVDNPNTDISKPGKSSEVTQSEGFDPNKEDEATDTQSVCSGANVETRRDTITQPKKLKRSVNRPASVTVEEAQKLTKGLMEKLVAIESYDSNETMDTLKAIGRLYWDYKPRRTAISEILHTMDFAGLAVKYLVTFNKLGIFKSDTVWFPAYYTLNNAWNYTDASKELAKDFADKGIVQLMIANIAHKPYLENITSKNVHYVLKSSLSILQNVSKIPEAKDLYLGNNAIEALKPFTTSDNDFFKAVSMMTLTTIINEADNAVLEDTGVIPFMVYGMMQALAAKTHRYRGFNPTELADCLARMAVNDSNKMKIVTQGALPQLVNMLKGSDPAEQASAAQCLWTLSFDNEVRGLILQEPGCVEHLELLMSSEDKAVRVAAKGAMWKLKKEEEHASQRQLEYKEEGEVPLEDHIMISYNWSHQDIILDIAAKLKAEGYRVWLDVDQMGGSTLDAMASAVEKAAVVIVCMSEKYKLSPNCRTEGEYTFQLRKPIVPVLVQRKYRADGWLGMLIGAKLFTDFSGKYPFEKAYRMLVKELRGRGHASAPPPAPEEVSPLDPVVQPITSVPNQSAQPSLKHNRPPSATMSAELASWSKQRIAEWLIEHKLESCVEQFSEVDGCLMLALMTLRTEAPEYFYNTLEKKFCLDIHNILQLINAMSALP